MKGNMERSEEEERQKCKRKGMIFACSGFEHAPSNHQSESCSRFSLVQSVSHATSTGARCNNSGWCPAHLTPRSALLKGSKGIQHALHGRILCTLHMHV